MNRGSRFKRRLVIGFIGQHAFKAAAFWCSRYKTQTEKQNENGKTHAVADGKIKPKGVEPT